MSSTFKTPKSELKSAKTELSQHVDALFNEIDFNFQEKLTVKEIVNETCKSRLFKMKPHPFNLSNIRRIKDELGRGSEVEVRYGYFSGKKFIPGVPKEAFYNLLKVLQDYKKVKPQTIINYIVNDGKTMVRIAEKDGEKSIESKTRIEYRDIIPWGLRIAASEEVPFSNPERELDLYGDDMSDKTIRRKVRYSFPMKTRQWDLTIVTDPKNPNKSPIYEVEIEYNRGALNDPIGFEKRVEKDFKDGLMHLYKSSKENLMSMANLKILMENHNNLFNDCNTTKKVYDRFYEIENKPGYFNFNNIFTGDDYLVTPKLDGLRRRIFIDVNGVFILNPGTRYAQQIAGPYAPTPETAIADTLMDTEYYDKTGDYVGNGKYFPFDVLIFNGVSYLNKPFSARISKAKVVNLDMFDFSKPFFRNGALIGEKGDGNFFDSFEKCIEWQSDMPDIDFDGQIAQPENPPYKSFTTMKIKPLDELTIDLYTEIDNKGYVTFKSYTATKKREQYLGEDVRGMQVEKFGPDPIKWKQIKNNGPSRKKLPPTFIAEYNLLREEPFIRFKNLRLDKIKPNFSKVVSSVKKSFYDDPITEDDLLGETLLPWRKWASANKRNEIAEYVNNGSRILDIGVGRGGTLLAAAQKGSDVYGIDPNKKNLKDLWKRIDDSIDKGKWDDVLRDRIQTMVARGQDTEEIIKFIGDKVDVVISMFSLSFFFESEDDLNALINTIDKSSEKDGTVIVNFMDGDRVGQQLKNKTIDTDLYKIKLGHKNKKDKKKIKEFKESEGIDIGIPISITLKKETDPIFKYQEEWLAPADIFIEKMNKKGFQVIKDRYLDDGAVLPDSNDEFSELNRSLIFKRTGAIRQRAVFQEEVEKGFLKELSPGKSEKMTKGERHGVEWDESSFIRSVLWLTNLDYRESEKEERDLMVSEYRDEMNENLTKKMFRKLKGGNVEKRLAFDKLYTRFNNNVIQDENTAREVGFIEYKGRVSNGPVGHEISLLITEMNPNIQIILLNEEEEIIEFVGENKSKIYIMKIGDYAYAPITKLSKKSDSFKSALSKKSESFKSAKSK
jgi:hypothetical protein